MPAINFKEIPEAHIPSRKQDTFEYFAETFLEALGFKVFTRPSRGRDEGMDLIIVEERNGVVGKTEVKWLVSCKHKAHSGKTVTPNDEKNIDIRVAQHGCQGFIGFYSVGISSGLSKKIEKLNQSTPCKIFDSEKVEEQLLMMAYSYPDLFKRYFPVSYQNYIIENPRPISIYAGNPTIKCSYCDKDLLVPEVTGMFFIIQEFKNDKLGEVVDVYFSCHGDCDRMLSGRYDKGYSHLWQHISDFTNPQLYIKYATEYMFDLGRGNEGGKVYTEESLQKLIISLRILFTRVSRKPTRSETERAGDIVNYGL